MAIDIIKIENREVFNIDYRELSDNAMIAQAEQVAELLEPRDKFLAVINFDNTIVSTKTFTKIISVTGSIFNAKNDCVVFVGITGIKKIMFNIFMRMYHVNAHLSDSEDQALDYLNNRIVSSR